jgi:hypothetical protein
VVVKKQAKVFLSYAADDRDLARSLAADIAKAGYNVWSDLNVLPGDNFAAQAGEALDASDAMVVIVSPASAESEHVQREVEFAIGSERFARRVIPVIAKPTKKMPWILERLQPVRSTSDPKEISRRVVAALEESEKAAL